MVNTNSSSLFFFKLLRCTATAITYKVTTRKFNDRPAYTARQQLFSCKTYLEAYVFYKSKCVLVMNLIYTTIRLTVMMEREQTSQNPLFWGLREDQEGDFQVWCLCEWPSWSDNTSVHRTVGIYTRWTDKQNYKLYHQSFTEATTF